MRLPKNDASLHMKWHIDSIQSAICDSSKLELSLACLVWFTSRRNSNFFAWKNENATNNKISTKLIITIKKYPTNLYIIKYWRLVRLELYFRPKLIQIQIYLLSPNDWHRLHLPQLMSAICGQHYKWHYTIWCYKGSLVSRLMSACCKYTARLVIFVWLEGM